MPKAQFWTNKMISDLRKCGEIAKEKEKEQPGLLFCSLLEAEWMNLHPRTKFNAVRLMQKHQAVGGEDNVGDVRKAGDAEEQNGQDVDVELAEGDGQKFDTLWTPEMLDNLEKCKEKALKIQDAMKKRNIKLSYMKIMHKEWLKLYPNSTHSANNLQTRLFAHQKQKKKNKVKADKLAGKTEWTQEMLHNLQKCHCIALKAKQDMKGHGTSISYMNVMVKEWKKLYPDSTLSQYALHARLWEYQKEKTSQCNVENDVVNHDEVSAAQKGDDKEAQKNTWLPKHANMPEDQRVLYSMKVFGQRHASKPLFDGICYNCGMMLFSRISEGHKFLIHKDVLNADHAPVDSLYEDMPTLPFKKSDAQWYSCKLCSKGIRQLFPCVDPETGL